MLAEILKYNDASQVHRAQRLAGTEEGKRPFPDQSTYLDIVRRAVAEMKGEELDNPVSDEEALVVLQVQFLANQGKTSCTCNAGPSSHRRWCATVK